MIHITDLCKEVFINMHSRNEKLMYKHHKVSYSFENSQVCERKDKKQQLENKFRAAILKTLKYFGHQAFNNKIQK